MRIWFWASALIVAYVYVGYPALLLVWAWFRNAGSQRTRPTHNGTSGPRGVSIVIAARNEGTRLAARINNLLALAYPVHRRQIIVVSDGSTDDTSRVLASFDHRIESVYLPPSGKAAALNAGVARARFDVVVFADARQTFASNALRALTAPFDDPRVGAVTGELLLGCEAGGRRSGSDRRTSVRPIERRADRRSTVADAVGLYWQYEKGLRRLESTVHSTLGATGAIYAIRRSLWRPLPHGTILDDVLSPMRAVLDGYRVVFEPNARAFDGTAPDSRTEARRKVRTLAGNF